MLLHYRPVKAQSCCLAERQKEHHWNGWSRQRARLRQVRRPKIEDDDDDDAIPYKSRRSRTTLPKGVRPFKRINLGVPGLNYANPKKKGKKIVKNLKK